MIDILFCTNDKEKTADFYRVAEIELNMEQHGNGPVHYSFCKQSLTEIYPLREITPDANVVIRITVNDIEEIIRQLKINFPEQKIISEIIKLKSGKKSVVYDPDGRVVEFFQPFGFYNS